MNAIEIMMEEHKNIKLMLKVVRKVSLNVLKGEEVDFEEFNKIIDFIRNYADKHHHQKEEDYLFNKMVDEMGTIAEKLVNQGMLVEHDLGRLYVKNLVIALEELKSGNEEAKLDIIANAIGYANHLSQHIHKEDNIVYKFAERELKSDTLNIIDKECEVFENDNEDEKIKYLNILKDLSEKYDVKGE